MSCRAGSAFEVVAFTDEKSIADVEVVLSCETTQAAAIEQFDMAMSKRPESAAALQNFKDEWTDLRDDTVKKPSNWAPSIATTKLLRSSVRLVRDVADLQEASAEMIDRTINELDDT